MDYIVFHKLKYEIQQIMLYNVGNNHVVHVIIT